MGIQRLRITLKAFYVGTEQSARQASSLRRALVGLPLD